MSTAPLLLLALSLAAQAQDAPATVYTTESAELLRWSDSTVVVKNVEAGAQLDLLVREDGLVRVRTADNRFGWLPADKVTEAAPAAAADSEGGFQLGGALPSLGGAPLKLPSGASGQE